MRGYLLAALASAGCAGAKPSPGPVDSRAPASPVVVEAPAPVAPPTLYAVGYAHLDTQWRWEYPDTIARFLPNTLQSNFALFERYPHYVFNFSGANRYRFIKEYDPRGFEEIKRYVAAGRWFPAGSSMEEGDVNSPSAESILRQILYGNQFFKHELGKTSEEYMLPDCFGFPASLPSLLAHAGIKGFSTQKLVWGSSARVGGPGSAEETPRGIPFDVGLWQGPDGKGVIAALHPGAYDSDILTDLSTKSAGPSGSADELANWPEVDWPSRIERDRKVSGIAMDYRYFGTGDTGGAPEESSVALLEATLTKGLASLPVLPTDLQSSDGSRRPDPDAPKVRVGEGPVHVVSATADQMFLDILKTGQEQHLPRFQGELELTNHSAGSLTSQAMHKRWNHENELLASSAEAVSVGAAWLSGVAYPRGRLNAAWNLVMGGQFHDILAGTATPKAYEYSWNDDVLAMNQFSDVLLGGAESVAASLDTRAHGISVVVWNPIGVDREDIVEATLALPDDARGVRVVGPDALEVPSQLERARGDEKKVVFLARVPSLGFAVYDVQPITTPPAHSDLKADGRSLENPRYRVGLNAAGDIATIFDKLLQREILSSPARLALQTERPRQWPAWNMDWEDQQAAPRAYVDGPAEIRLVEEGPARVAIEVRRSAAGSKLVRTVRLSAGDAGNRVEIADSIDWHTSATALKATFPLSAANREATYALGAGTITRANDDERTFEVSAQKWFDLTDAGGGYGTAVLSGGKVGSDKPDDHTLRLTLLYTPGLRGFFEGLAPGAWEPGQTYTDQATQDWGHHEMLYGLASHAGGWRGSGIDWQAERLDAPLIAFESASHEGPLGTRLSLLRVSNPDVRVMALKKAEESDELIVRVVEMRGETAQDVRLTFASALSAAREVDGQERPLGAITLSEGAIVASLAPYQIRTFAVRWPRRLSEGASPSSASGASQALALPYDLATSSLDGSKSKRGFSRDGRALPAELLPSVIDYHDIRFEMARAAPGEPNAVVPRGQVLPLPAGAWGRLYLLAASDGDGGGDETATFRFDTKTVKVVIQNWTGDIGQADVRRFTSVDVPMPAEPAPSDTSSFARRTRHFRTRMKTEGGIRLRKLTGLVPGFIKRAPVAWFASHRHTADGQNEPYAYSYLYAYELDVPPAATELTLPNDERIRILAATIASGARNLRPAQPLYDVLPPDPRRGAGALTP